MPKFRVDWKLDVPRMVRDLGKPRAEEMRRRLMALEGKQKQRGLLKHSRKEGRGDKGYVEVDFDNGRPVDRDLMPPAELMKYMEYNMVEVFDPDEAEKIIQGQIEGFEEEGQK